LLREADLALYRAKDNGRDRAEVFDEELRTTAVARLVTERLVRHALDEHRLVVEYQPIIDLVLGRCVGVEALVRIRDLRSRLLLPDAFLVAAEQSGLLVEIDDHVLTEAVTQAGVWRRQLGDTDFTDMAINVTARHLADVGFTGAIIDKLDAAGLPHHSLQVEVTERTLIEASRSAMTGLRALRDAGVQVGLDDFGTGYSSLAYLLQFPLDFVKIDRSFIADLDRGTRETAIVAAIIGLAHALELTVVAEGVETQSQLHTLQALHCDRVQGFVFAHSSHPDSVIDFLSKGLHLADA
jgi:EAL domain-containing protein (putative c-di-GMP-specific phosphodiesterase class I)